MENQHRKISGYRELNQEEIDLMNEIKAVGPQLARLIERLHDHCIKQKNIGDQANDVFVRDREIKAQPRRWISIGETHLQQGLMALTRAVAQPEFF